MSPSSTKSSPSSGSMTSRSASVTSSIVAMSRECRKPCRSGCADARELGRFYDIVEFYEHRGTLLCSGDEDRSTQGFRRRALARAIRAQTDVVVDLSGLEFADASLMLDLAVLARRLRVRGRALLLRKPQPQIWPLIE